MKNLNYVLSRTPQIPNFEDNILMMWWILIRFHFMASWNCWAIIIARVIDYTLDMQLFESFESDVLSCTLIISTYISNFIDRFKEFRNKAHLRTCLHTFPKWRRIPFFRSRLLMWNFLRLSYYTKLISLLKLKLTIYLAFFKYLGSPLDSKSHLQHYLGVIGRN